MALKDRKRNQAREYSVIFFGLSMDSKGRIYPLFIKVLKSTLVKLGLNNKVIQEVPSGTFDTNAGLNAKFTRDDQGTIYRRITGTKNGITYNEVSPVNPELGGAKLTITLEKKIGNTANTRTGTANNRRNSTYDVSLAIPPSANLEQVKFFINRLKLGSNVLSWKFGKTRETLRNFESKNAKKSVERIGNWLIPLAEINRNKLTKEGNFSKASGASVKTIVYAKIGENSAKLLGFTQPKESTDSDVKSGTKFASVANNAIGGKGLFYSVFQKMELYSQVWTKVSSDNKDTKTAVTVPGTGINIKVRFTQRKNAAPRTSLKTRKTSGNRIKSTNSYAYLQVPSGTPLGLIMMALSNMPKRGRSFQISTDGKTYGNSYDLPQKSGRS